MTVHFVYTIGEKRTTPHAITNQVARALRESYNVVVYDWLSTETIEPEPGDILLGHPAPPKGTIFRNSIADKRWAKRIIMSPFAYAVPELISFLDPLIEVADHYLAITGTYWMRTITGSIVEHWGYKTTQLDLAVDPQDFPLIKHNFSPPGGRGFLYIGRNGIGKGTDYFARLADANPKMRFGAVGDRPLSKRIVAHGRQYTADIAFHSLAKDYDFLLTCGSSDPNPTTILEAASWGLVPVCTPQCGYESLPWLFNLPLNNVAEAGRILDQLQYMPDERLRSIQQLAREPLRTHFTWDRFNAQVLTCIRSPTPLVPNDVAWRTMASRNSARLRQIESRRILRSGVNSLIRFPDRWLRRSVRRYLKASP